jgi:predicted aldo/keto reductase-like oxidoreductase
MSSRRSSLLQSFRSSILSTQEEKKSDENNEEGHTPSFLLSSLGPKIASILENHADKIHDDSFLKIIRQLEFWHTEQSLRDDEFLALAERLASIAGWREDVEDATIPTDQKFTVPKVRFGKTEIQMPIITCGGMRVQETWIPDTLPLLRSNKSKVVKSKSQQNLRDVILSCLKVGLNHFETARLYGSSEVQFVDALINLIAEGTIQRSDFIFQTKLLASAGCTRDAFAKQWEASWSNVKKLGYVDLLSFHCVSDAGQIDTILSDAEDGIYNFVLDLKKEGKIKHIGFSTHGSAENILRMINSNKMDYVNLHHHYFGDYHAAGTSDTLGGQGNGAAVKRALELDMGVFNISPFDKGGKLYRPSAKVAAAIGPELNPMAFAALYTWRSEGMHTLSVGLARSSDLDEVIEAAKIFIDGERADALVNAAKARLDNLAIGKLGKEWYEKGLLNVPSFYEHSSDGVAIGHLLWLHNCLTAFGMYEFSRDRYSMLEKVDWNKSKSFDENVKKNL